MDDAPVVARELARLRGAPAAGPPPRAARTARRPARRRSSRAGSGPPPPARAAPGRPPEPAVDGSLAATASRVRTPCRSSRTRAWRVDALGRRRGRRPAPSSTRSAVAGRVAPRPATSGRPPRAARAPSAGPGRGRRSFAGPLPAQGAQRRERVVRDLAGPHEVPQRVEHLAVRPAAGRPRTARGRSDAPRRGEVGRGSPRGADRRAGRTPLRAGPVGREAARGPGR